MSNMIKCDACGQIIPANSREYHEIWIDRSNGYHLCRRCYERFMTDILHWHWSEDDQDWVDQDWVEEDEEVAEND